MGQGAWQFPPDDGYPGYGLVETVPDGDNVRPKEMHPKMETAGADKVEGRTVYVVEATPAACPAEKLYFEAESGLPVKHDFERVTLEDGTAHTP